MTFRFLFLLRYYFFWIIIFLSQKIFFLLFNRHESFQLGIIDWIKVLLNGLKLDLSAGAYIIFIPALLIAFSFKRIWPAVRKAINIYTYILLFIVLYLGVVDMDLYSYWGFKLDITPLLYIKTPGEALASVSIMEIALLILFFALLYYGFSRLYIKKVQPETSAAPAKWWKIFPAGLFITAFLIVPARGGFGIAPMNLSSVYFHHNRFANHSAINVFWNTMYSITERNKLQKEHHFMDDEKAIKLFEQLYAQKKEGKLQLVKENPNVVLIILESFSNKIIEALGGEKGITPTLNQLCKKSVLFDNFYASGDRSDKGMVSIFSGFPAQPTTSIINYPAKAEDLPLIFRNFSSHQYQTAFFYGGDLNFANFKAYFSDTSIHKVITVDDFPSEQKIQKWGVSDEFLFKRMIHDMNETPGSFFYSCFTLSSHEPFDVPMDPVFGTSSRDEQSRNGFYYTDQCIKNFLEEAKKQSWYENTLIIFVADHGSRSPGNTSNHVKEKFKIPMIWTGGAVLKDTVISKTGSQVDIPATLLSQCKLKDKEFKYSKDLLDPGGPSFAFYAFNNGFGFVTDSSFLVYDNDFEKIMINEEKTQKASEDFGKAFLQVLSKDFIQK